jgi:hypothetical protein
MKHSTTSKFWLAWVYAILLGGAGCTRTQVEPTPAEVERPAVTRHPPPVFQPVAGSAAVRQAMLMSHPLPELKSHLDIRTILVRAGDPVSLTQEHDGVFELRTGDVALIEDGKPRPIGRGEMWQVNRGDKVTLKASGEVAVLRAIYLIAREK